MAAGPAAAAVMAAQVADRATEETGRPAHCGSIFISEGGNHDVNSLIM